MTSPRAVALLTLAAAVLGVVADAGPSVAPVTRSGYVGQEDHELVAEFQRVFRRAKDTPTRVEAVLALEGTESPEVVDVLAPVVSDPVEEVALAALRVLGGFHEPAPIARLIERLEGEKKAERAVGLLGALERGGYGEAREAIEPWLEDSHWEARRAALLALAATAGSAAVERLLPLLEDGEPAVRCAAFDALAGLGAREVVAPAIAQLDDDSWRVRASAIGALAKVRDRESIGPLIGRMAVEEGRLVQDIAAALSAITGRDFGLRVDGWQGFWELYSDRFQIPTAEELARLRAKQAERRADYAPSAGAARYCGVETPSRRIVFVIDISGSMEQEVADKERYATGGYPSLARMDIVKTELRRTIDALDPSVRFNILTFGTEVKAWKKKMVPANVLYKSNADTFLERLEPLGGASKTGLAEAGLVASANLEAGKTNTYDALMTALQVDQDHPDEYATDADTIFFLSDGRPSTGRFIDPVEICEAVQRANALRRVVIHTIAIGEFQKGFMMRLAVENGGTFVDLGK